MPCPTCDYPFPYGKLTWLAADESRHSMLRRCPDCSTLYDFYPDEKSLPEAITEEEARLRYRGAL